MTCGSNKDRCGCGPPALMPASCCPSCATAARTAAAVLAGFGCRLTFSPLIAPVSYRWGLDGPFLPRGSLLWVSDQTINNKRAIGSRFMARTAGELAGVDIAPGREYLAFRICEAAAAAELPAASAAFAVPAVLYGGLSGLSSSGSGPVTTLPPSIPPRKPGGFTPEVPPPGPGDDGGGGVPPPIVTLAGCLGIAEPYLGPQGMKWVTPGPPVLPTIDCDGFTIIDAPLLPDLTSILSCALTATNNGSLAPFLGEVHPFRLMNWFGIGWCRYSFYTNSLDYLWPLAAQWPVIALATEDHPNQLVACPGPGIGPTVLRGQVLFGIKPQFQEPDPMDIFIWKGDQHPTYWYTAPNLVQFPIGTWGAAFAPGAPAEWCPTSTTYFEFSVYPTP